MAVELATAYVSIVPSTRGIKGQLQQQLSGPVGQAGQREGGRFGAAMAGAASKALKVGIAGAAAGFAGAVFKGFNRLRDIDDATFKLEGLGHDAATVETIMQSALDAVKGTAFGLGEAATIAASAVASGIEPGDELTRVLSLTGDAAAIAGTTLGEMGSIFGKVAAGNRMMTEEMNQLTDRGVPVLQWLQEEYGATAEEVRDMVSSGEVDFATFAKIMEDNIGGAALTAGESFRGSLANVGAAIGRFGAALLGPAFERGPQFFAAITAGIDRMTEVVGPAISKAIDWIRNLGDSLGGDGEMAGRLAGLRDSFASIWSSISGIVKGAFDIIKAIIGPQLVIMKALWDQFGDGIMAAVGFAFDHIVNIITTVLGVIEGVIDVIAGVLTGDWERAWNGIKNIFGSIMQGIHNTVVSFWDAFGGFITRNLTSLVGWFRDLPGRILGVLGGLGRILFNAGKQIISGLWDGLKSMWSSVTDWLSGLGSQIRDLKGPIEKDKVLLEDIGESIIGGLGRGMSKEWAGIEKMLGTMTAEIPLQVSGSVGAVRAAAVNAPESPADGRGGLTINGGVQVGDRRDLDELQWTMRKMAIEAAY